MSENTERTNYSAKTALVTGANSGVGFEACRQLAAAGWGKVILACRSETKAEDARAKLTERTGRDPFSVLALDTAEVASAKDACEQLRKRGESVDFLLLNAGATSADPQYNANGVEITWASTLVGHHTLTMCLLENGGLSPNARIVIAGSGGARGTAPGMKVHAFHEVATEQCEGDLAAAIDLLARIKGPYKFKHMNEYVSAKVVVAWWAGGLSRKLPQGMTANAVSPGSAPATGFARDASFMMRRVMMPVLKVVGPLMGMAGSLEKASRRYLDAADLSDDETGHFYATAHRRKAVGSVGIQTWPEYFTATDNQEAGFEAVVRLTGVPFPEPAAVSSTD